MTQPHGSHLHTAMAPAGPNDYAWHLERTRRSRRDSAPAAGISVIIPTYNRGRMLGITLASLVHQTTRLPFEVVVADDGSEEAIVDVVRRFESLLDVKYVRHRDDGFRLSAVRNLGLRVATHDWVAFLDCDIATDPDWLATYIAILSQDDDVALTATRKYVSTDDVSEQDVLADPLLIRRLPEAPAPGTLSDGAAKAVAVDWRLIHFQQTDNLRLSAAPFRFFSGANIAFARKWIDRVGGFDENFNQWGGEDNEFGYRLYRAGCFLRAVPEPLTYHQEPPHGINETDRAAGRRLTRRILERKVPYFYRKPRSDEPDGEPRVPLVSLCIVARDGEAAVQGCIESALGQTITDLEVCVVDDGLTDATWTILKERRADHPRVRVIGHRRAGGETALGAAIGMARGFYVGYLEAGAMLESDDIERCVGELAADPTLACVSTGRAIVEHTGCGAVPGAGEPASSYGTLPRTGSGGQFHLFTTRAWALAGGASLGAASADELLRGLAECGSVRHLSRCGTR